MTKKQRKDEVIKVLNQMIQLCEPFAYADFNKLIPAKKGNNSKLIKAEKENSKIGYVYIKGNKKVYTKQKNVAITTLSLFATLTDILGLLIIITFLLLSAAGLKMEIPYTG